MTTLTETTLGGLSLSPDLVLTGLEASPGIIYSQRRTMSGVSVLQTAPVVGGRTLGLNSENHLSLTDIQAIQALAALGQPVTLVHHRGTFNVLIIGLNVEPVSLIANPDGTLWHSGEITLLEV